MRLKKRSREKLKEMSIKVYGSSGKWKSILNKPVQLNAREPLTGRRCKEANYATLRDVYTEMKEKIKEMEKDDE